MENEERDLKLETLRTQFKELCKQWEDIRIDVSKKILSKLEELRWKEGLELLDELTVDITSDYYNREQSDREVAVYVKFKSLDETRGYDFGSSFTLTIHQDRVEINHGCCGSFDKSSVGQLSRLHLMPMLFEHEQELLDIVNNDIDMQVYKDIHSTEQQIDNIESEIKREIIKEEEEKIKAQLVVGKYLAVKNKLSHYDYDKYERVVDGYKWSNIRKIKKITNKYVVTEDAYSDGKVPAWASQHNEKKESILTLIRNKQLFIVDNLEVCPE